MQKIVVLIFLIAMQFYGYTIAAEKSLDLDLSDMDLGLKTQYPKFLLTGYLKTETAYRFRVPRTFTKIRNIIQIESNYEVDQWSSIHFSGWAYHDLVYDLFDYRTITGRYLRDEDQPLSFVEGLPQGKDSDVAQIRELFINLRNDWADLRMGKQWIIWGIIPGIRVVDELNPLDFRELILPDLLDYRIPLWSAKLDTYWGDSNNLQFVWIPDLRFNKPAPPGSEWELFQIIPGTTFPDAGQFKNSEIGIRYKRKIMGAEITLSYFNTWDDFPVLFRHAKIVQVDTGGGQGAGIVSPEFYPSYHRMQMYGGTFQKTIWGQIFNAEGVFVTGKYFGLKAVDNNHDGFLDHDGVLQKNHARLGLGVDFNVFKTEVSPSLTEWYIFDYDPSILQDRFDTTLNVFIRKTFSKRSSVFELLGIYLVNLQEIYLKPQFSFRPASQFEITVGMNLFYGNKSHLGLLAVNGQPTNLVEVAQSSHFIGNFSNNDRIFVNFKYSF